MRVAIEVEIPSEPLSLVPLLTWEQRQEWAYALTVEWIGGPHAKTPEPEARVSRPLAGGLRSTGRLARIAEGSRP